MKSVQLAVLKRAFELEGQLRRVISAPSRRFGEASIAPFRDNRRAAVSISADLELCWAWRQLPAPARERRAEQARRNVPWLIDVLAAFDVPVTWATVGHLLLESCAAGPDGRAHCDMPRPPRHEGWQGDWYQHDPCSDVRRAPGWYAPDLVGRIAESKTGHELATHSFSHIDFSSDASTAELVEREMSACADLMQAFGATPRSLVFCFNRMGYQYLDLLATLGVTSVRHRDARVRLSYPERTPSGVYKIYESMNLRVASKYRYADKARVFLDEAITKGAAYHIWFHPSDPRGVFEESFVPILECIREKRDKGEVWVTSMRDLAAYCEARHQTEIRVRIGEGSMRLEFDSSLDSDRFGDPLLTVIVALPAPLVAARLDGGLLVNPLKAASGVPGLGPSEVMFNVPSSVKWLDITLAE